MNKKSLRNLAAAIALAGVLPALATDADAARSSGKTRTSPAPTIDFKDVKDLLFNPDLVVPLPIPPVQVQIFGGGETLRITGNNFANDVTVTIDDSGANRVYVYNHDTLLGSYPSSPMKKIQIMLKGGDDDFFVGLADGASHKFTKHIDITAGDGDDTGFVDFRGTTSNAIVQGSLTAWVNPGKGDDEVFAHFARKHGGKLDFWCVKGSGDDSCSASMWGDISGGADVSFRLEGGSGADHLWSWNTYDQKDGAYSDIRVSGDSTFDILLRGGSGADTLSPTFGGEADGKLTIKSEGSGGNDKAHGTISVGNNSGGNVKLRTYGQNGQDDLKLNVNGSAPFLSAKINGGSGYDVCQGSPIVSMASCP